MICASSDKVARGIRGKLSGITVKVAGRAVSLGSGIGGGTRRNVRQLGKRLKAFKARIPRFKALRRCGVRTDRLLRTGGTAALTFGQKGPGVANSMLLAQRRAAVAMTCDKPCGADLDLSLIIADGGSPGAADPAFERVGVIHFWGMVVWERWAPVKLLQVAISDAMKRLRGAKNV